MKKWGIILSITAACAGLTNSFAANKTTNVTEYLYVQSANVATLEPIKDSTDSYVLTLKDIHPRVVCFSERPTRLTGSLGVKQFINEWNNPPATATNSFKDDAPNADLMGMKVANQEQINFPVELSNPQYNAKDKTLSYTVNKLRGSDKISAMQLQHVSIVIDYCSSCPPWTHQK